MTYARRRSLPALVLAAFGFCSLSIAAGELPAANGQKPKAAPIRTLPGSRTGSSAVDLTGHIVDLTHPVDANTPTFSGAGDEMSYQALTSLDKDGYRSGAFRMPEHFGTHADAPAHFIKGGKTIDQIDPGRLVVPAVVIDARKESQANPDYQLSVGKIRSWEKAGMVPYGAAVLMFTAWSRRYSQPEQYRNADAAGVMHFPGFSADAVKYLVANRHACALGIDTLSIDPGCSKDFAAHKAALGTGLYLMENLANLDRMPARGSLLFCGPMMIRGGSGSPARVLVVLP